MQAVHQNRPTQDIPPPKLKQLLSGSLIWQQITSLAKYLTQTEVHTYAFSVAANAILSLFPGHGRCYR
jgi:hypothetical protein